MFFARWDQGAPWNNSGIEGTSRWLHRVMELGAGDRGESFEGRS